MTMQEMSRLIIGLRGLGLGDKNLADFLLWVESGDEKYKPKTEQEQDKEK